jgi:glycosyltransferase involved in cell wall biosynthesis
VSREILGHDYPCYFRAGDADDLARGLRRLISEPQQRRAIGMALRDRVLEQQYLLDAMGMRFAEFLEH